LRNHCWFVLVGGPRAHYPAGMGGRGLFRYFSLIGLAYVVTTLAAGLTTYLTKYELSTTTNLFVSGGVGLATAMTLGAIDLAKQKPVPAASPAPPIAAPGPYAGPYGPTPPAPHGGGPYTTAPPYGGAPPTARRRGRGGLVVGALVLLVLCAGGGYGLTQGVGWAADKLSEIAQPPWKQKTRDPGVQRIAAPASQTEGPLTITVTGVRVNDEVTMVDLTTENTGSETLNLPIFKTCQLASPGQTFEADPAASDNWHEVVAPNSETPGTIVFDGVLAAGPAEITLTFAQIYGGLDSPRSISVRVQVQ
jgi:hypothetical protein